MRFRRIHLRIKKSRWESKEIKFLKSQNLFQVSLNYLSLFFRKTSSHTPTVKASFTDYDFVLEVVIFFIFFLWFSYFFNDAHVQWETKRCCVLCVCTLGLIIEPKNKFWFCSFFFFSLSLVNIIHIWRDSL